ncbi:MAG: NAD(P)-dependent glycerol-3-phosphate dehydrogenase [Lentisphaeria bacterium]|nr:NAD(P)-dependent glycerol-3-phosphate dehydrogenase [Lentisphaeria bacterium]
MKITVLSDGAWGTALALVLVDNKHDVTMWGPFPDYIREMNESRYNSRFLPGVKLADGLKFESDIAKAVENSEAILLASPSQYLRSVLEKFKPFFDPAKHLIINVAKGIEVDTWLRMSEVTSSILGECRYVAVSGPSHAEEVSRKVPTLVVAASKNIADAESVRDFFMNDYFRVYTSTDILGVELGGALKNVMAIAAGIIDGMKLGDNPKAALITRGIAEMSRLGVALGGDAQTFAGLSGVGDLIVTCCSGHSRNRHVGECLGEGRKLDDIIKSMGMVVAEGVVTAKGAKHFSETAGVETPIITEIYNILYSRKSPETAIRELMTRSPKQE